MTAWTALALVKAIQSNKATDARVRTRSGESGCNFTSIVGTSMGKAPISASRAESIPAWLLVRVMRIRLPKSGSVSNQLRSVAQLDHASDYQRCRGF